MGSCQGFANEAYAPSDVGKWIAEIDAIDDPDGDGGFGLIPADGGTVLGINQLLFHKGHMIAPLARNAAARGTETRRGAMVSFDISDLENIKRTFFQQDEMTNEIREAHGLVLSSGDLLCINTILGVQFWNVSDPTNMRLVSDLRIPGMNKSTYGTTGWWVMGQHPYYYLGSTQRGLQIIKAVDPANPIVVKRIEGSAIGIPSVGSVHCVGNLMVLGSAGHSESTTGPFATLDISDPENPRLLDLANGTGNYSVGVYGNYITTHGFGGLTVWTMANPSDLQPVYQNTAMNEALYSCFADKHFHIPNFRTYEKFDFPIPGAPHLVSSGVSPIEKVHEFTEKLGNLIVATGGGDGDGVKFLPHQVNPDTQPPEVNFTSPAHHSVNVGLKSRIGVIVTDTLDFDSVHRASWIVKEVGGAQLDGAFSYSRNYLNFTPSSELKPNTTYELIIPEGGIKDIVGNGIVAFRSRFSTGPEVLQAEEPLVVITSPTYGKKVSGNLDLGFSISNFDLGTGGRSLAWSVNGVPQGTTTQSSPLAIGYLNPGQHTIQIDLIRDGEATGLTTSTTFEVIPQEPNKAPRVTLVSPKLATPGSIVSMDASLSSDPDRGPDSLSFQWQQLAGPSEVVFGSSRVATTSAKLDNPGEYDFRIFISDGDLSTTRDFRITVRSVSQELLMITETGELTAGDVSIRNHLVASGASVVGMPVRSVTREMAESYRMVLLSDSILKSSMQPYLREAEVPVVVLKPQLFDDLGLTGRLENQDFGNINLSSAKTAEVQNALTPLFATGSFELFRTPIPANWGRPGASAIVGVAGENEQALLFGYEQGTMMVSGIAPRRRVGLMVGGNSFGELTPDGLLLFNHAIAWAAGSRLPVDTINPEPGPTPEPSLTITSPSAGATLTGSFSLNYRLSHFALGSQGRSLAWSVDGVRHGVINSLSPISITGLSDGPHTIKVDLLQNEVPTGVSRIVDLTVTTPPPPPNQAPRISLVSPTSALLGETVVLNARQSTDPDGGPGELTFQWGLVAGPAEVIPAGATASETTIKLVVPGNYDFRLSLSDGDLTARRDFRITVREPSRELLMVTPNGSFAGADIPLRDHLVARGFIVVGIGAASVTKVIAERYRLVLVSGTISSPTLNSGLIGATVPVVICEAYVYDDFGMTARVEKVDFGNSSFSTAIISSPANALTVGLPAGQISLFTKVVPVPWGRPGPNAIIGAASTTGQSLIFGYEQGAAMVTGNAPARRVGMMLEERSFSQLTPASLALFNHAIDWATGSSPTITTPDPSPGPPPGPSLSITSPLASAELTGNFAVTLNVSNFALGSGGRSLSWFVDGIQQGTAAGALPISITGLSDGPHTIRVDLLQNDLSIGVSASVGIVVETPPPPPNQGPRISLVVPTSVLPGTMVALDASQSLDPDGGPSPMKFRWTLLGDPTAVSAFDSSAPSTTVRLTHTGTYDFRLTVGDGDLTSLRDFRITVREAPREVLMVTPNGSFAGSDIAVRNHLVTRGFSVVGIGAKSVTKAVAERYGLVLVSGTISSPTLNVDLTRATVPILVCEAYVYDDFGMTARLEKLDFGNSSSGNATIPASANALTAGLPSGQTSLFTKVTPMPWGRPSPGAIIGAASTTGQGLVFGYEQGAAMMTGIAPGRRVGMMLDEKSFAGLTPAGIALFNNAVDWATATGAHVPVELEISDSLSFGPFTASHAPIALQAKIRGGTGQVTYRWEIAGADGVSTQTQWSPSNLLTRSFPHAGNHSVILRVQDEKVVKTKLMSMVVHSPPSTTAASSSSGIALVDDGSKTVWNVNPDNDSVTVLDAGSLAILAEIPVAPDPRSLVAMGGGEVWITSHDSPSITIISQTSRTVIGHIDLPRGSAPEGITTAGIRSHAYVALQGAAGIAKINTDTRQIESILRVADTPKGLAIDASGQRLFATHFISPDESGKVTEIDLAAFTVTRVIDLGISNRPDSISGGRGLPNYLGHPAITPDGAFLLVPSKQDNILRGISRDGLPLSSENTVRSIVSKIDLTTGTEIPEARWDIDNSNLPSTAAFSPLGNLVFVSLQGNNSVAVLDAYNRREITRFETEAAPDTLFVDNQTGVLYIHHHLARSVAAYSIEEFSKFRTESPLLLGRQSVVRAEKLSPQILSGKRLFYNSADPRMNANGYISCASCHLDGGGDGRVWDFTNRGEGLRNTTDLRGRSGTGHGPIHWSANFDEIQDFENDIRLHFDGLGFLSQSDFDETSAPLGTPKSGRSPELDALAAYVSSLDRVEKSPHRNSDGSLTTDAIRGRDTFKRLDCASCHSGDEFTDSALLVLHDTGTLKPTSGGRLGGPLTGIDTPTLKGLWGSAPFFHDGSARTLRNLVDLSGPMHGNMASLEESEKNDLIAYLNQIEESEFNPGVIGIAERIDPNRGNPFLGAASDPAPEPPVSLIETLSSSVSPARGAETGYFEMRVRVHKHLEQVSVVETSTDCKNWKFETAQRVMIDDTGSDYNIVGLRVPLAGRAALFVRIPIGKLQAEKYRTDATMDH